MDNKTNTFQIILIAIFAVCVVAGVLVFSRSRTGGGDIIFPKVVIWGTISKADFDQAYAEVNLARDKKQGQLNVEYVEKRETDFDHDLIEALASGVGPDSIIISQDQILRYKDKIYPIPYESFSLRDFKDSYIDEADLYLTDKGIVGFPFYVDPLVLYWNKDMFAAEGIPYPPKLWTELFTQGERLIQKDQNGNLTRSIIALGEFSNVTNAKEILSALLLQSGTPIVREEEGLFKNALNESDSFSGTQSVVGFYTEFSNPSKISYSWNRAMPQSKNAFVAGDLALYIGFASELPDIRLKNPNLNFDVALLPQPKDARTKITYGTLYAFSVLKSSKVITGAFQTLIALSQKNFISLWVESQGVAPALRNLLSVKPKNADLQIFYDSALIARGWLDPNVKETGAIFKDIIEGVSSGRLRVSEAVSKGSEELDRLLK